MLALMIRFTVYRVAFSLCIFFFSCLSISNTILLSASLFPFFLPYSCTYRLGRLPGNILSTSGRRFVVTFVSVCTECFCFFILFSAFFSSSAFILPSKIFPAPLVQSPNDPSCRAGVRGVNCRKQGMKKGYWSGRRKQQEKGKGKCDKKGYEVMAK